MANRPFSGRHQETYTAVGEAPKLPARPAGTCRPALSPQPAQAGAVVEQRVDAMLNLAEPMMAGAPIPEAEPSASSHEPARLGTM